MGGDPLSQDSVPGYHSAAVPAYCQPHHSRHFRALLALAEAEVGTQFPTAKPLHHRSSGVGRSWRLPWGTRPKMKCQP